MPDQFGFEHRFRGTYHEDLETGKTRDQGQDRGASKTLIIGGQHKVERGGGTSRSPVLAASYIQ
jgi:hypothetical protein